MHTGTIYLVILLSILDLILLNADTEYSINMHLALAPDLTGALTYQQCTMHYA